MKVEDGEGAERWRMDGEGRMKDGEGKVVKGGG
jgi:hypothetical protein